MGVVWTFLLSSVISLLSPSLRDGPILTEILSQGSLDPKQPTKCASLATFLTTQNAVLEYVKQKLHDVRENKADHVCMYESKQVIYSRFDNKLKSQQLCLSRYSIKILFVIYNTNYDFTLVLT